jgi:putative glutamine amidotransferase
LVLFILKLGNLGIMSKPLIGLTTSQLNKRSKTPAMGSNIAYIQSVTDAGGIPLLIPSNLPNEDLDDLLSGIGGILFTGGLDLDPASYGSTLNDIVGEQDTERDRVELYLTTKAIHLNIPFFGICRGCQVVNVALGGSLYEDLSDQYEGDIQHDNHHKPRNSLSHSVKTKTASRLAGIIGENTVEVNSLHHQGIKRLASELESVAIAPDGLVEAVELATNPFGIAVQWHPEELQEYEPMRRLFRAFVQACQFHISQTLEGDVR